MTPIVVSIVAAVASVALLVVVLELIRSRRLRERSRCSGRNRGRAARAPPRAQRPEHDRRWVGVTGYLPAVLFAVATPSSCSCCSTTRPGSEAQRPEHFVLAQRIGLLERGCARRRSATSGIRGRARAD
jgi:hypothetical protein